MGDVPPERAGYCWAKGELEAYGDRGVADSMVEADQAEIEACGPVNEVVEMVGGCVRP